jgi:hypothetical protein
LTEEEALSLQRSLMDQWAGNRNELPPPPGGAMTQSLRDRFEPRRGLAIGRIRDPRTGRTRLEARITQPDGPATRRARKLIEKARKDGAEIEVRDMGPPVARVAKAASGANGPGHPELVCRADPLHIGCSVAHVSGVAGTIGAFVRMPRMMGVGALSCCHVLALGGKAKAGQAISQPGWPDQSHDIDDNHIGVLTPAFSPFLKVQHNNLDAAVAELTCERGRAASTVLPPLACVPPHQRNAPLNNILPASDLNLNDPVAKLGRSTGYTVGRVSAVNLLNLDVTCLNPRRARYMFSQVIEIAWEDGAPFGAAGDSGALVYRLADMRAIGLYFASFEGQGAESFSYAIQLDRVRDEYNLTLV